MGINIKELKGHVMKKFYTITAFANAIGWTRNKSSRIINGVTEPTIDDIVAIATILELSEGEFFTIFFASLSTMCTATA